MAVTQIPAWTLGDRLHKARKVAGIKSHARMAEILGVHVDTIKRYESGTTTPSRGLVIAWATVCDVSADWLELGYIPGEGGDANSSSVTVRIADDAFNQQELWASDLDLCHAA